jgi:hypothetical protein
MSSPAFYEVAGDADRIGRGDIALIYLPQSRVRNEAEPPLAEASKRVNVPAYSNLFSLTDDQRMPGAEVRVCMSLAVVVMDSCELDRHFNQGRSPRVWDSRVAVAPIVFESSFPSAPWRQMEQGDVPLYGFFLPPLPRDIDGLTAWPRAIVDLRGTTLVSRRLVELNRRIRLGQEAAEALGLRLLEFWYLREISHWSSLEARRGKLIRDIVPVVIEPDYTVLRLTFDGADPLLVGAVSDPI